MATIIVSYDGTDNDDDALTLGLMLARDPRDLALAYVRHTREIDPEREALAQHDAERRLEHGSERLTAPEVPRHVVFSASTGEGLEELAGSQGAELIVFGSDYRTPPGHAEPPVSAQRLLEIGSVAIAVAAAGLRSHADAKLERIAVLTPEDPAATQTAEGLASAHSASVVGPTPGGEVDLIVVGSQQGAPPGRVALTGSVRTLLDASRGSVLVLPAGRSLTL